MENGLASKGNSKTGQLLKVLKQNSKYLENQYASKFATIPLRCLSDFLTYSDFEDLWIYEEFIGCYSQNSIFFETV